MGGGGLLTSRALPLLVHNHLRDEGSSNPLNDQASVITCLAKLILQAGRQLRHLL